MRRLLLFACVLGLVGASTAFAASLTVQSEDVSTFTTDVSISVPTPPATATRWYLAGSDRVLPGLLGPNPPTDTSVNAKAIDPGTLPTRAETDPKKHHSWQSDPMPVGGLRLRGPVVVRVFQNGGGGAATAGLFVCASDTTATTACTQIAGDASSAGVETVNEIPIDLGTVDLTVPAGSRLRLVIVNPSARKWNLQWGYKSNRESRVDLPVVLP